MSDWPAEIPGEGPKKVGPVGRCMCGELTWVEYGGQPRCRVCAWKLVNRARETMPVLLPSAAMGWKVVPFQRYGAQIRRDGSEWFEV